MFFDFDEMQRLHKEDPEEFAALAKDKIYDYIYSIPDSKRQEQLMALQCKIDRDLSRYKDPIARMNRMVELFWIQVRLLDNALNLLPAEKTEPNIPDNVVQFPNKNVTT